MALLDGQLRLKVNTSKPSAARAARHSLLDIKPSLGRTNLTDGRWHSMQIERVAKKVQLTVKCMIIGSSRERFGRLAVHGLVSLPGSGYGGKF